MNGLLCLSRSTKEEGHLSTGLAYTFRRVTCRVWIPGEAEVLMFGLGRAEGGAGRGTSDGGEEQASSCVSGPREKNVPLTGAAC